MSEPSVPEHVVCAVTGKAIPLAETVILDGKMVGAEGKTILLERVKGGNGSLPGHPMVRPGVWRRFGAITLDLVILCIPFFLLIGVLMSMMIRRSLQTEQEGHDRFVSTMGVAMVAGVLLVFVHPLLTYLYFALMHGASGKTLGKMAFGLRVVRNDGTPLGYGVAFRREFWRFLPVFLGILLLFPVAAIAPRAQGMLQFLIWGHWIYGLISSIVAATDDVAQRAIHDRMGKTRTIRALSSASS